MARRKARQEQLRRESAQRAQQAQAKKIADQATAGAYNAYRSKQTTAKHYANMIRPVIHSLDEPPRLDIY